METKKVNKHKIAPIAFKGGSSDKRPILGSDLISHLYTSVFLVAKKNTGKTTVINHILQHCAGSDTEVIAFCSTLNNDPSWEAIKDQLESRGVTFQGYTDLFDDTGVNRLRAWLDEKSVRDSDNEVDEEPIIARRSNAHLALVEPPPDDVESKKKRKPKYRMPETIFVFDDFSKELRNPVVADFIKRHRHYKTKVIISSQYIKDIVPATAQNIDIWLLFRGRNNRDLEHMYELASPGVSFEQFSAMYKKATETDRYGFLYADVRTDEYRMNFDEQFVKVR